MKRTNNAGRKSFLFRHLKPYILISPAFVLTIGILGPFIMAIIWSFTNYRLIHPGYSFVGVANYVDLLTGGEFWHTIMVTVVYTVAAVGIETVLGLVIALLLNQETIMTKMLRPLLVMPLLTAPVIGTLMWKVMMSSQYGVLNYLLSLFNPGLKSFPWAGSINFAMLSAVLIDVWTFTPFIAILALAGLRSLPKPPFEAARVDGASDWFIFKNLTMPYLAPYLAIGIVFRLIDSILMFDIPFALTGGGPGDALMNLSVAGYTVAFTYLDISRGCAYMFLTWLIVFVVSNWLVSYWRRSKFRVS